MRYLGLITISAAILSFGLTLGAAPQPAEAGKACNRAGLPSPCIKKSDIRNNQVRTNHVKNNNLGAIDMRDEAGADFVGGNQFEAVTTVDEVVRSISVTAPDPGVILVFASGTFDENGFPTTVRCSITAGLVIDGAALIEAEVTTDNDRIPFAGTRGFNRTAGTHTFNLVCDTLAATGANILDSQMTAIFTSSKY